MVSESLVQEGPITVFGTYSVYYDALYQDKDYLLSADYVHRKLCAEGVPSSLFYLGCGTPLHLVQFVEWGIECVGCALSPIMIERARLNLAPLDKEVPFFRCNARELRLDRPFSAVTALFHVFSYQTSGRDALQFLETAFAHLKEGGLFLFYHCYGPAVLTQRPEPRRINIRYNNFQIVQDCRPEIDVRKNLVHVHYDVEVSDDVSGQKQRLQETRVMGYFFETEIEHFAAIDGFKLVAVEEWLTGNAPNADSLGVTFLLRKE